MACGAAAGVSAAFKAPIGGMLYLMELSTRWRLELTWRTFFSTSVTAVVLKLLLTGCEYSHICGFIVPQGRMKFAFSTPYVQLPIIGVFSVLMGLLGALFVAINSKLVKLRKNWSHSKRLLFLEVRADTAVVTKQRTRAPPPETRFSRLTRTNTDARTPECLYVVFKNLPLPPLPPRPTSHPAACRWCCSR